MSIIDPMVFRDKDGNEYTQKEFWLDEDKQEIVYKYTNGKQLTEREQKEYLVSEDVPVILPGVGYLSTRQTPGTEEEILTRITGENEDFFMDIEKPLDQTPNNKSSKLILDKVEKSLESFGYEVKVDVPVTFKVLDKDKHDMLCIMLDISDEMVNDIIVEKAVKSFMAEVKIKVKEKL